MKAVAAKAPSFRLYPELRVKLNKLRLEIDTIGLYRLPASKSLAGIRIGAYSADIMRRYVRSLAVAAQQLLFFTIPGEKELTNISVLFYYTSK